MTHTLILDIGNVICAWSPQQLVARCVADPALREAAYTATIGHPDWLDMDRGVLNKQQAVARAQARSQIAAADIAAIYDELPASLTLLPDTVAAMRKVRESGYPMYLLSNMSTHAWEYLRDTHECFAWCDGVAISCHAGCIKPEKAIFRYLCDRLTVSPGHCLFIDDMAENVAAARHFGFASWQLTDRDRGGAMVRQWLQGLD